MKLTHLKKSYLKFYEANKASSKLGIVQLYINAYKDILQAEDEETLSDILVKLYKKSQNIKKNRIKMEIVFTEEQHKIKELEDIIQTFLSLKERDYTPAKEDTIVNPQRTIITNQNSLTENKTSQANLKCEQIIYILENFPFKNTIYLVGSNENVKLRTQKEIDTSQINKIAKLYEQLYRDSNYILENIRKLSIVKRKKLIQTLENFIQDFISETLKEKTIETFHNIMNKPVYDNSIIESFREQKVATTYHQNEEIFDKKIYRNLSTELKYKKEKLESIYEKLIYIQENFENNNDEFSKSEYISIQIKIITVKILHSLLATKHKRKSHKSKR